MPTDDTQGSSNAGAAGTPVDEGPAGGGEKSLLTREDAVIIAIIALGLIGPLLIYLFAVAVPPLLVAVFLGLAVSAVVYRFLGGIGKDTSFTIGALRLGGTMAALLGCVWFFDGQIERQTRGLDVLFDPHPSEWFALETAAAAPVEVEVRDTGHLRAPDNRVLASTSLALRREGQGFEVVNQGADFAFGRLSRETIEGLGFDVDIGEGLEGFVVTDRLEAGAESRLPALPFSLVTGRYELDYSGFHLVAEDEAGTVLHTGSIHLRETEIVRLDDLGTFLVAVIEVDHAPEEAEPYAKFAIGRIAEPVVVIR